jgi:hypothetical protein
VLAGEGGAGGDEIGGSAREDDPAAVVAGAGAEVDDPVGQVADPRRSVYLGPGDIPYATHPVDYAATLLAFISRGPMF